MQDGKICNRCGRELDFWDVQEDECKVSPVEEVGV